MLHSLSFQFHTDIECKLTTNTFWCARTRIPYCNPPDRIVEKKIFRINWFSHFIGLPARTALMNKKWPRPHSISFTHCNGWKRKNRRINVIVANTCHVATHEMTSPFRVNIDTTIDVTAGRLLPVFKWFCKRCRAHKKILKSYAFAPRHVCVPIDLAKCVCVRARLPVCTVVH